MTNNEPVNIHTIQTRVKRRTKQLRFSDIREAHATILTKYLRDSEIDFLQGRVSGSGFMRNYFNPALIDDLKDRVFKGIESIEAKLKSSRS